MYSLQDQSLHSFPGPTTHSSFLIPQILFLISRLSPSIPTFTTFTIQSLSDPWVWYYNSLHHISAFHLPPPTSQTSSSALSRNLSNLQPPASSLQQPQQPQKPQQPQQPPAPSNLINLNIINRLDPRRYFPTQSPNRQATRSNQKAVSQFSVHDDSCLKTPIQGTVTVEPKNHLSYHFRSPRGPGSVSNNHFYLQRHPQKAAQRIREIQDTANWKHHTITLGP
jgi:hypothetical protein